MKRALQEKIHSLLGLDTGRQSRYDQGEYLYSIDACFYVGEPL